jgi:EAL domain-containing protein (putative c-di-GMP-specific phosphodiesterase class I)
VRLADLGLTNKRREAEIELAIKRAIAHDGFQIFLQPIFSVPEQRIVSAEALLRLIDDRLGPIPPAEFIPIAERNGSILEIGSFLIDWVCAFLNDYNLEQRGIQFLEINLSIAQCIRHDLCEHIAEICKRNLIRPEQLCFEVTETTAATSPEILTANLKSLSRSGYVFALDDYGTGYSNINHLLELPFSFAKLDRSIVAARFTSVKGRIMLESIIDMLKKMDMKIIAEGVETGDQARVLTDLGCDLLQGYYFSRPVPSEDFLRLLEAR